MFKVGDKVRVLYSFGSLSPKIGEEVILLEKAATGERYDHFRTTNDKYVFSDDIELVQDPRVQSSLKLKVKKLHPNAVIPSYAKPGDAAMDITATDVVHLRASNGTTQLKYSTGIAVEIPEGHVGLIFPRSSICKTTLALSNSVGVIDSGYRGEIQFVFNDTGREAPNYVIGDRIGQLMVIPYPKMEIEEVEELSETERGTGGFGSSGK